mgnify:CR=1 FL=1
MQHHPLLAISPLDGRYHDKLSNLGSLFSEFALIQARVRVELAWLASIAENLSLVDTSTLDRLKQWEDHINRHFSLEEAEAIKGIESTTQHDVKAVEYWLAEQLKEKGLSSLCPWLHFACTSEDINNLAYGILLKNNQALLVERMDALYEQLDQMATRDADSPMLARTHGQTASPTTLGKECRNIAVRLKRAREHFADTECLGKCNGAVGNFNAHVVAYPDVNWITLSRQFVESLGLSWQSHSTQIEPHDGVANWAHALSRFNTILIDASRDFWQYISLGYFQQERVDNEVGSSTMPHKINPIDFENAEGNLGIANALATHFANKLPISRLQRDLSDSTVLRNIGVMVGHSDLAYQSMLKGLKKLHTNHDRLQEDLENRWEVLAEAIQTVMRAHGIADAYEQLKTFTRGETINQASLHAFINQLSIPEEAKQSLLELTPNTYTGLAETLAKRS